MKHLFAPNRRKIDDLDHRSVWLSIFWYFSFFIVLGRLFYWQVIKSSSLQAEAESQYTSYSQKKVSRGRIFTADNHLLVGNQTVYRLFADPSVITQKSTQISSQLLPILLADTQEYLEASQSAIKKELETNLSANIESKLNQKDKKWVALKNSISQTAKDKIADLEIYGLGYEPFEVRYYPEASAAAHLTGFVGKDETGAEIGYFGVEGALDKELKGISLSKKRITDALGLDLLFSKTQNQSIQGRDVVLTIRRDIQLSVEELLAQGMEKYGAKSGEVIVMEPKTGKILALAALPKYDQKEFYKYDQTVYKNPTLADTYEPGSTFKTLTVSAGIDSGSIQPDTKCPVCAGPRKIGKYLIRTWNDVYNPDIDMTQALAKSDNTAMIYVTDLMGKDKYIEYLQKFKIGQKIEIDLQEDRSTPLRDKYSDVDLATNSFGQGIVVNSMQLVRAVGAIANQGEMVRPTIIEEVVNPMDNSKIKTQVINEGQVISKETAQKVSEMMIQSALHGEAQWTASRDHTVAGKTGTSQVVVDGKYDEEKTIASFIGFAPAADPKFIMIVKLNEPASSPWAAETAAPLWYKIANRLFLFLNIPPDRKTNEVTNGD